jgi:hypothetical protein
MRATLIGGSGRFLGKMSGHGQFSKVIGHAVVREGFGHHRQRPFFQFGASSMFTAVAEMPRKLAMS